MKQLNSVLAVILLMCATFSFTSCSSDDDNKEENNLVIDIPGKIPGLGDTEGELTGTPFVLPEGVTLTQTITGTRYGYSKSAPAIAKKDIKSLSNIESEIRLRASSQEVDTVLGAGYFVQLHIALKNTTTKDIEVVFPAGMIIVSNSGNYQNGVLLKKVSIKVPAGKDYKIALLMFCGNSGKSPSSTYETYRWAVVSNSSLIVQLCNMLTKKKINYEDFKDGEEGFSDSVSTLQGILWSLTDYGESLEDQIKLIQELPNM